MTERVDVVVVGAGLAGLNAAWHLQRAGLDVVVCEAGHEIGGRIRTDVVDGFRLDRGFQVLLPAYPAVQALPGLRTLRLQPFTKGVIAARDEHRVELVPPWQKWPAIGGLARHARDLGALGVLSARDMVAPNRTVRGRPQRSTASELSAAGLSDEFVSTVMRPFLAGVFLDRDLITSSRMFHLIWRSFLRGGGALPASGMGALPHLLSSVLQPGTVRCHTAVEALTDDGVRMTSREVIHARAVVVATDGTTAAQLLPGLTAPRWHSVKTYYYRVSTPPPDAGTTLFVDATHDLLLNTAVISNVAPGYAPPGQALIAASVPEPVRRSAAGADRARAAGTAVRRQHTRLGPAARVRDPSGVAGHGAAAPAAPTGTRRRRPIRLRRSPRHELRPRCVGFGPPSRDRCARRSVSRVIETGEGG